MYLDWKVGDRVVYVVASDLWIGGGPSPFKKGRVYTIDGFDKHNKGDVVVASDGKLYRLPEDAVYIGVEGIDDLCHVRCFRKVQPRKTSIAIFEAMLHGNRSEVEA